MDNETFATLKNIATARLNKMGIYAPYVRKFNSKAQVVTFFEQFGGFYANAENGHEDLVKEIAEIEKKVNGIVYAIEHCICDTGDTWSFLYVSEDDITDEYFEQEGNVFYVDAAVRSDCTFGGYDFGSIGVQCAFGGMRRVA